MTDPSSTQSGTTHVLMLADMSGSMAGLAEDVRGGFNTYVADLAEQPGDYRLTVTLFDTEFIPLCTDAALTNVPKLTGTNYSPRGATALLDALGKTVGEFETRVELADGDRVMVVVQTDGLENSSREWRFEAVQKLIKEREASGRWSFIYLGAGADTWSQAERMGFGANNYVNTSATGQGTASTYAGLVTATRAYSSGASGAEASGIIAATPGVVDQP
jgi:uncharacterized protein YegL